jgi:hypothetical protein
VGLLEGVGDGQVVKVKGLQNGPGCLRRLGGKVHPQQSAPVTQEAGEVGGGDVGAGGLAGGEKDGADHGIGLQNWEKSSFLGENQAIFMKTLKLLIYLLTKFIK